MKYRHKINIFASAIVLILLMSVSVVSAISNETITPVGDIIVTGSVSPTLPLLGTQVHVNVTVRNTFKHSVINIATVTITGLEGQPIYQDKSYGFGLNANSAKKHEFIFDTTGWEKGDYNIMITFPVQDGESNVENNIYETAFRVVAESIKCRGTSKTYKYVTEEWLSGDDGICRTVDDDYSNIKYIRNCGLKEGNKIDYLDYTAKCMSLPFDVKVKGVSNTNITPPQTLDILATVSHNSIRTVEGKITVSITGAYPEKPGDFVYSLQTYTSTKDVVMKHYDTIISDESLHIFFDTTNWNPGMYHVTISFPPQNDEVNILNNIYEYDIKVLPKPKIVDLHLTQLDGITQAGSQYIKLGEYFGIEYTIVNEGNTDSTGVFTITTEGITFYTSPITVNKGERKSGLLTFSGSQLPYRPQLNGYTYEVTGEVTTPGDINPNNNRMHLTLPMKG